MTGTASLLPIAHEAVDIARELILARAPGSIQAKGDRDFASEVDVEVERAVRDFLGRLTPGIGFLGEEEGARGAQSDLVWTLDPLDGTSNFIHGIPLCAVVLGLVEQRGSVLGVIDLPLVGARYFGVRSAGAYVGERRLRARPTRSLRDAVVSVGDYAVGADAERKNRLRLTITY